MKIWVDADAVPNDIKDIILRASERLRLEVIFVANKDTRVGRGALVSFVRVTQGADVADAYIVDNSAPEDIAITADIPLAALLVAKGVTALDPRGEVYSEATIGERKSIRDFMAGLRDSGVQTGGPRPLGPQVKQKFAAVFDSLLTKALKKRAAGPGGSGPG